MLKLKSENQNRNFYIALMLFGILATVWRYREPSLLYPEIADDVWFFVNSTPGSEQFISSVFGHSIKSGTYLLFSLLHPIGKAFLPDTYVPLIGYSFVPEMVYTMMMMGVINFWAAPFAGYVAFKITGSYVAGGLAAVFTALSPHQNLLATAIESQLLFLILQNVLFLRIWHIDGKAVLRRDRFTAGALSGLVAAAIVLTSHHSWFIIAASLAVIVVDDIIKRTPGRQIFNKNLLLVGIRAAFPYISGMLIGLSGPLIFFEAIFWFNWLTDGWIFPLTDGSRDYFGLLFFYQSGISAGMGWSWDTISFRWSGFAKVFVNILGWQGAALLAAAVVWGMIRHTFGFSKGVRPVVTITFIVAYILTVLPFVASYGRMTMPLEFPAFLLISQMAVDGFSVFRRHRIIVSTCGVLLALMSVHMLISSYVVQESSFDRGRAAKWLKENPKPIYWTKSSYSGSPQLSPNELRNKPPETDGYFIVGALPSEDWMKILPTLELRPLRTWRTAKASWGAFDVLYTEHTLYKPYPYQTHIVVYDMRKLISHLRHRTE